MALTNLTELYTSIKDWAVRADLSDTLLADFVTLTEGTLNHGSGDVPSLRVRDMETTATVTMTSGTGTLPTDFLEAIKVTDPGDITRDIQYATPDWIDENYPTGQDATYPFFYTIIGDQLLCPIDVSLTYYARIPSLVGDSMNWLMTKAPSVYLNGALMQYSIYDKDAEKAVGYRGLMLSALAGLQASDLNSRAGHLVRRAGMTAY
jgi:hypothetical protein